MNVYGLQTSSLSELERVKLKRTSAEVTILGFVAHLSIKLIYENDSTQPVEVTYVCPVDANAAVYSFEANIEERRIAGYCLEKKQAKNICSKAIRIGEITVLGSEEKLKGDVLHLALGNLPAGATAELRFGIVTELPIEEEAVFFTLPTVFHPKYCPIDQYPGLKFYLETSRYVIPTRTRYILDVKVDIIGTRKIARLSTETTSLNVERFTENATGAKMTLGEGMNQEKDWSFKIYYEDPFQASVLQMAGDQTSMGVMRDDIIMLNLLPEADVGSYSHNELIFVIDRSGSMEGYRIQKAKSTLLLLLKSLLCGCRFNIISFGSSFSPLFNSSSEPYTEETLNKALDLQKNMDADMGGTEILKALKHVYSQELVPGYARQIIVLTDGSVWDEDEIFSLIKRFANDARVFSVGIGDGASKSLVRGMAKAGGGRYEMVDDEEELQKKTMSLLGSMLQENIQDLQLEWDLEPCQALKLVPKVPPRLFGDQRMIFYGRVSPKTRVKSLRLTWKLRSREFTSEISENQCRIVESSNYTFQRLAAKAQLKQWELEGEENVTEQMSWSVLSNVICKATSFVLVDQDGNAIRNFSKKQLCSSPRSASDKDSEDDLGCPLFGKCKNKSSSNSKVCTSKYLRDTLVVDSKRCFLPEMSPGLLIEEEELHSAEGSDDEYSMISDSDLSSDETSSPTKRNRLSDSLLDIASAQTFDGSWNFERCFELLPVTKNDLKSLRSQLSVDDVCFATALILAYFTFSFESRKLEWKFLHHKGYEFLETRGVDVMFVHKKCREELERLLPA